jgi:hypothetical protein
LPFFFAIGSCSFLLGFPSDLRHRAEGHLFRHVEQLARLAEGILDRLRQCGRPLEGARQAVEVLVIRVPMVGLAPRQIGEREGVIPQAAGEAAKNVATSVRSVSTFFAKLITSFRWFRRRPHAAPFRGDMRAGCPP